ncbi:MAG: TonB family protein [Opitutae bacterium]|nr:TonB family protein [Opitutae bacterium]
MKTPAKRMARLGTVAALLAPLALLGDLNEASVSQLRLTRYTEPVFPTSARMEGIPDGLVTLAISRDAAGVPGDILVIDTTDRRFTEAALEAARSWRFAPAIPGTEPAAELVRIGFRATGVVYIAAHSQSKAGLLADQVAQKLREPVRIPELQSLPSAPKAIHQPMPAYPAALTGKGVEGRAEVRFFVDEEGRVRLPQVVAATKPEFAAAALAAVAQWRYEPPRVGSRRLVVAENWSFKFGADN